MEDLTVTVVIFLAHSNRFEIFATLSAKIPLHLFRGTFRQQFDLLLTQATMKGHVSHTVTDYLDQGTNV